MKKTLIIIITICLLITTNACSLGNKSIELTPENLQQYLAINVNSNNERQELNIFKGYQYYKDVSLEIYPIKDVVFENVKLEIEIPQFGVYENAESKTLDISLPTNGYYTTEPYEVYSASWKEPEDFSENDNSSFIIKSIEGTVTGKR